MSGPRAQGGGLAGWLSWSLCVAGCVLLSALAFRAPANPLYDSLERLELKAYDARVRAHGGLPFAHDKLALVCIDDETFARLKASPRRRADAKWPFPTSFHAEVAQRLLGWGARLVAFDLLSFANPSRSLYAAEDAGFAALARESQKVVLASKFDYQAPQSWAARRGGVPPVAREYWVTPDRAFQGIPHGFVNAPLDVDGWVRRYLPQRERLVTEHALAVTAVRAAGLPCLPDAPPAVAVPLRWIPFTPPDTVGVHTIPYAAVLDAGPGDAALAEAVRNRLVFVGPTFSEAHDAYCTPYYARESDTPTPGVFLHATLANALIAGASLERYGDGAEITVALLMLAGGLALAWLPPARAGFLGMLIVGVGWFALGFAAFRRSMLWLPLASPLAALAAGYLPQMALRLALSERRRAVIKDLFQKYVSAEVFQHVQAHPELLNLEGERREATVFFSDLAGFTTISETLPPGQLSALLNAYLTPMTRIVMENRGYVDKYIGDALMAVFGVPLADEQHALHACRAALEQRAECRRLAADLAARHGVEIYARMGVNTGEMSAGNMGSLDRFQYTVMGDVVNQASRFEGANKIFGSTIMIGDATHRAVAAQALARKLARLTVKGKHEAVFVYELLGLREACDASEAEQLEALIAAFDDGLAHYERGEFARAVERFEAALAARPGDGPSQYYLDLAKPRVGQQVPSGWTGEVKLFTK